MYRFLLLTGILLCGMGTSLVSAQNLNQEVIDAEGNRKLLGKCNRNAFLMEAYKAWFEKGYDAYEPKTEILHKISSRLEDIEIEIFMGTWCGDSRRGVPQFYKVMDQLGIEEDRISLINLDNGDGAYKQSPTHEEAGKLIHRVPTFIVNRGGKEIGRIVESPITSFEMDLAQIVYGLPSSPNYKIVKHLHSIFETMDSIPQDWPGLLEIARKIQHDSWNDRELNTWGYVLMAKNDMDRALAVFRINAMLYRKVPNVYDSLGEALAKVGEREEAIQMYERVLNMEPDNQSVKDRLALLKEKRE